MIFTDKYAPTTEPAEVIGDEEPEKIVLGDDAFAICEMLDKLCFQLQRSSIKW